MHIDFSKIEARLKEPPASGAEVSAILDKALCAKGIALDEASALLSALPEHTAQILQTAATVKEKIFGRRIVLFAPLYLSNYCSNACLYCGFRSGNRELERTRLSIGETVTEARALVAMGFKRVLLVTGEDPLFGLEQIISAVRAIYKNTGMRIVHVNTAPMGVDEFKELKKAGVGVYQSFQETYHKDTYAKMHPHGRKKDFDWRLGVMDRALTAGFGDVGIGPLFGLAQWRFDCLSAIAHSMSLYAQFGAHAHTISVPRLRTADNAIAPPMLVTDNDIKKIVAVLRLAVPTAGVVISTREPAQLRQELINCGASQMSAGSRTNPGGYTARSRATLEQFPTTDHRTLPEVMASIVKEGGLPSLCTSCYRVGRVGSEFTEKTSAGEMEKLCHSNAILTLKEYITDYSKNGVREHLEQALKKAIDEIKDPAIKKATLEKLREIENGKRDIFF
ncbi:[FeFe] hydrogenase H-cluster radical SAM maturase HydG [bacterium]|nr:MAG: [FeFe] hydrogenase H-cluster radical SAM maturase HydG [bacterium]